MRFSLPAFALLLLTACGESEPAPDPKVVDAHLNSIIAQEEAAKAKDIAESRAREEVREAEIDRKGENFVAE